MKAQTKLRRMLILLPFKTPTFFFFKEDFKWPLLMKMACNLLAGVGVYPEMNNVAEAVLLLSESLEMPLPLSAMMGHYALCEFNL